MLRAAKHLDLNVCVLRGAGLLLARLREQRLCRYDDLLAGLAVLGTDADVVFLPAVHFLFLLGRLEYHPKTDSFEYLEPGRGL